MYKMLIAYFLSLLIFLGWAEGLVRLKKYLNMAKYVLKTFSSKFQV